MAKVELLAPKIFKWEGMNFVNDPLDKGGATKFGVTIATWRQVGYDKNNDGYIDAKDIRLLTIQDATIVLKRYYWDRWKADEIQNQSVASILVDWVWGSGKWGIIIPQRVLGVVPDGIVGPKTIAVLNHCNQEDFFNKIVFERRQFLARIVERDPRQIRFYKGWLNRLNDFKFE